MFLFLLLVLGVSCILPVCSGLPFKLPFSNISLCFCLSKKKKIDKTRMAPLDKIQFFLQGLMP